MTFLPPRDFTLGDDSESWMSNLNITKEPVKGIYTQYREKRHERQQYHFGDDYSRYSENIEKFAHGVDPMKEIQYNNTKGRQQAYKPIINPILRVPQRNEFDLQPLSRLPVEKHAYSSKKNIKIDQKQDIKNFRNVHDTVIQPEMKTKLSQEVIGGSHRKEQFAKEKKILSTPYITKKNNDKVKTDFESLRAMSSVQNTIQDKNIVHSLVSRKNIQKKQDMDLLSVDDHMIQNKLTNQLTNNTTRTLSGSQKVNVDEDPTRGISDSVLSISIQSSRNKRINKDIFKNIIQKEIDHHGLKTQIATTKVSKANLLQNRDIQSRLMKDFHYNVTTSKTSNQHKKETNLVQNNNDAYLVANPLVTKTNNNLSSLYRKTNLDGFKNQTLASRVLPQSTETRKNTSFFQKMNNNKVDIKLANALEKDSFMRGDIIPSTLRDDKIASNFIRVKN